MSGKTQISGRLIAAARALTGISQEDFAAACGLPVEALRVMEAGGSAWLRSERDAEEVSYGLDHYGVIVIEESGRYGRWCQVEIHPSRCEADCAFGRRGWDRRL